MARMPGKSTYNAHFKSVVSGHLVDGRFECPSCRQSAVPVEIDGQVLGESDPLARLTDYDRSPKYDLILVVCAGCGQDVLYVRKWTWALKSDLVDGNSWQVSKWLKQVYPVGRAAKKFDYTDEKYKKDYRAACETLQLSPEASACMSRRCLQSILKDQGYSQKDLAPQIDALLAEMDPKKALPVSLHDCIDAIRGFGNFGAHIQSDLKTLEIVPVDPGEAEWCIEIIEQLFDHYFERPQQIAAKIASANNKFGAAGKPGMKS